MIKAALDGKLEQEQFKTHEIFGLEMPLQCEGVPSEVLDPRSTWADKEAYDAKANELADSFRNNFRKFEQQANNEILSGGPTA